MNIDAVLLTKDEGWKACINSNGDCMDKGYSCPDCPFLCKAQCLKLLEWLQKYCIEHDHVQIVGSVEDYQDAGCPQFERKDCPECMSELESKLKEGR